MSQYELVNVNSLKVEYLSPTIKYDISTIRTSVNELEEEITALIESATEDDIVYIKGKKTDLNKLAKALSDKRIEITKEIKKPIEAFENDVKGVTKQVQDLSDKVNVLVVNHENKIKDEKKRKIMEMEDYGAFTVFNEKWLNQTTTTKQIEFDLAEQKKAFQNNCTLIDLVCKASGLDPNKYYQMLIDGETVDSIKLLIENDNEVKQKYANQPQEMTKPIIAVSFESEIYTKEFKVKGTKVQLMALKEYIESIGLVIVRD